MSRAAHLHTPEMRAKCLAARKALNLPLEVRFWAKVRRDQVGTGCWEWTGALNPKGYGVAYIEERNGKPYVELAHRAVFRVLGLPPLPAYRVGGPVPDHLCRNRKCVNPDHLRLVTQRENVYAGMSPMAINRRKTECVRGHPFTPENTLRTKRGERVCRTCKQMWAVALREGIPTW